MIHIKSEMLLDIWDEIRPLFVDHYREIAHYQDIPLAPSLRDYAALEVGGALRCYSARNPEGQLVGYAIFFVRRNMHYAGSLQAYQDILYLAPGERRGMAGVRLIRFAEQALKAEGVQVVHQHAKLTTTLGRLFERLGYEPMDVVLVKRLD